MGRMGRLWFPAIVGLAAYYAIFGGEYSLLEVRGIRAETSRAAAELARLEAEADSLAIRADALENDPRLLETIARESWGMIREGEVLYRFADPAEEPSEADEP